MKTKKSFLNNLFLASVVLGVPLVATYCVANVRREIIEDCAAKGGNLEYDFIGRAGAWPTCQLAPPAPSLKQSG